MKYRRVTTQSMLTHTHTHAQRRSANDETDVTAKRMAGNDANDSFPMSDKMQTKQASCLKHEHKAHEHYVRRNKIINKRAGEC